MLTRYIPDFYAQNIFDVPVSFFKEHNIKIILSDLDNTLDSYRILIPSSRVVELKNKLNENNIELVLISNNKEKRIKPYATRLGVKYLYSSGKPFGKKIIKFIEKNGFSKENILMVGDQLMTDVLASKRVKVKMLLTEPIVKEDQPCTRINRIRDKFARKKLKKRQILQNLEVK